MRSFLLKRSANPVRQFSSNNLDRYRTVLQPHPTSFDTIGTRRFGEEQMRKELSPEVFEKFQESQKHGGAYLGQREANEIATAMLKWALQHQCTNFAHWYQPMRTRDARAAPAVKFDAFINLDFSSQSMLKPLKGPLFSGSMLFQGETDGSSFSNGGLRKTQAAASYVSWDKTSAPFIRNDTLYIPACFMTYHGDALDHKTPLLRAGVALNQQSLRVLRHLGDKTTQRVASNVGCEQEYFLIDADEFARRPDLVQCGRTLFGQISPRNQEGNENYFGSPSRRSRAFFTELRHELWQLGVSVFVNHNEVAPSQLELSPIFSLSSTANDQNMLMMEVMDWLAAKHGLKVLFHEKPFAKVNGSGKHNNWGLNTDTGKNLFAPGKTEGSQTEFMVFISSLMYALHTHGDLIRAGVATPGNDHRLGAQEAPPAIISLYTGESLYNHLQSVVAGGPLVGFSGEGQRVSFGVESMEPIRRAQDDRNRTAPFPFCGNRFEFRAVGSSQNIAQPLSFLDTAMADGLREMADMLDTGMKPRDAVATLAKRHDNVIFNGNGYSAEWQIEAKRRGLLNNRTCVDSWRDFDNKKNLDLMCRFGVMNEREVRARKNIALADYANTLIIEAQVASQMTHTQYVPAMAKDLAMYTGPAAPLAGARAAVYGEVQTKVAELDTALDGFPHHGEPQEQGDYCLNNIKPCLGALRVVGLAYFFVPLC